MPVSATVKWRKYFLFLRFVPTSAFNATSPAEVNLMALPTRLTRICRRRAGVAADNLRHPRSDVAKQLQSFLVGAQGKRPHCVFQRLPESKSIDSRSILPASILEKSRMSLITLSRDSADISRCRDTRAARESVRYRAPDRSCR